MFSQFNAFHCYVALSSPKLLLMLVAARTRPWVSVIIRPVLVNLDFQVPSDWTQIAKASIRDWPLFSADSDGSSRNLADSERL